MRIDALRTACIMQLVQKSLLTAMAMCALHSLHSASGGLGQALVEGQAEQGEP